MSVTIFAKRYITDVWQGCKYHVDFHSTLMKMKPEFVQLLLERVFRFQIMSRENLKGSLEKIVKK